MTSHPNDKSRRGFYEIGYGRPPVSGQFVKGKSGNPQGGRPKKSASKKSASRSRVDPSTRDRFLSAAARPVKVRDGDTQLEIPIAEAVMRAEAVAAMKGSPHAQKNFLEREARYRSELEAEIKEDHEGWREYCKNYEIVRSHAKETSFLPPEDWVHPEDLVFEEGRHVMVRGGDPVGAAKSREYRIRLREVFMLQVELDRRLHRATGHGLRRAPIFVSEVLVVMLNSSLPNRLQLQDFELIWRMDCNRKLKIQELKRRLKMEWTSIDMPDACNLITSAVSTAGLRHNT